MVQKIINVGTVANDGTGDTIRGAFTNVNANFTEVYSNVSNLTAVVAAIDGGQNSAISSAYVTSNDAYQIANVAFNHSNLTYDAVNSVFTVANAAYNNANVGLVAANSWAVSVGTAGNNYASILAANNAVGANAWANAVGIASNNWSLSTFTTLANTAIIYNTSNAAFFKANAAFANTTGTFQGNLSVTGSVTSTSGFNDTLGQLRERLTVVVTSNTTTTIQGPHTTIIANNTNTLTIKIPDDNTFVSPVNVGTTLEVYQFGTGNTKVIANDASVTIYSSNNWANIAGQYLSATAIKVSTNTWILTGDLKA